MPDYESDTKRKVAGYGLSFTSISTYTALYEEEVVEFIGTYSGEFTSPGTIELAVGTGLMTIAGFKAGAEGLKWVKDRLED